MDNNEVPIPAHHDQPKKRNLTVTVTLRDPTVFLVEVDWFAPSLNVVRCMLNEALQAVQEKIEDETALKFQRKTAAVAMLPQKKPGIV